MNSNFSELRKRAGFAAQKDLAQAIGVERTAVAKWETGRTFPRAADIPRVAEILCCTSDDVISAIDESRKKEEHQNE